MPRKKCGFDRPVMTIAVDWDVKQQTKQKNKKHSGAVTKIDVINSNVHIVLFMLLRAIIILQKFNFWSVSSKVFRQQNGYAIIAIRLVFLKH